MKKAGIIILGAILTFTALLSTMSAAKAAKTNQYPQNGYEMKLSPLFEKYLGDGTIQETSIGGIGVYYKFIPQEAKDALNRGDEEKAYSLSKEIALVILNTDIAKQLTGKDIAKDFDKNKTISAKLIAYYNTKADTSGLNGADVSTFTSIVNDFNKNQLRNIKPLSEALDYSNAGNIKAGSKIKFISTNMDGQAADSKKMFKKYDLTMINIWGTYCGPCITEMPDIQSVYKAKKSNVNIIGIAVDVNYSEDSAMIRKAKSVMQKTGATYESILMNDTMYYSLGANVSAVPTTIFVDKNGKVIGDPIEGTRSVAQFEKLIEERLKAAKK